MKFDLPALRRSRLTAVAIITVMPVTAIGWRTLRTEPSPELATASVIVGDIEDLVVTTGRLEAAQLVTVGAQVSGQIKVMNVEVGDHVEAGEFIAEIDSTTQEDDLRNARAALAQIRARAKPWSSQPTTRRNSHSNDRD